VTAIKDEVWAAHLLTSPEKLRHDRIRYNVDPLRGDRIRYRHFNRPQFEFLGRTFAWDMITRNWMLRAMKHLRFLRRLLPAWHARERAFRDWYRDAVITAWLDGRFPTPETGLEALELPWTCTGYRDVVYPKHDAARERFNTLAAKDTQGT
jgi:indolepyruvate ferredoxin oxidoreductase